MNGFLTDELSRTGRAGMIIDTGKGAGPGASRGINLDRNPRGNNSDMKGNRSINRGLRFNTISNRDKSSKDNSSKDNPRFKNLKANHKEDPRLNNHNSNNINRRFSNPNNSTLNLRASNTREGHNPHSLMGNLREGVQNMESRGLMSPLATR